MVKDKPLISIVIPSYNNGKYLEQCILSAINQTYSNLEIVIVDDQSSDNSVEIVNAIKDKYPEKIINLIVNNTNMGACNSVNNAIKYHTRGQFIKMLDSDDYLYNDAVSILASHIPADGTYTGVIYARCHRIDDCGKNLGEFGWQTNLNQLMLGDNGIITTSTLYSKKAFCELGGYPQDGYIGDLELWLKFAINSFTLYFVNNVVGCYRIHSSHTALTSNSNKLLTSKIEILARMARIYNRDPYYDIACDGIRICLVEMKSVQINTLLCSGKKFIGIVLYFSNFYSFIRYKKSFIINFWLNLLKNKV